MPNQSLRLNKFIASRIGISRREADNLIVTGKIMVNDSVAQLGQHIDKNDKVCYNKNIIPFQAEFFYLLFHKPVGYVCSRRAQGDAPTIYELLPAKYHNLKTVGRLDKDTSGLILLTNDGDFAQAMTHPRYHKIKIYQAELDHALEPLHQQMIADFGVELTDGKSRLGLTRLDEGRKKWQIEMSEGRNRQIRRTFGALGYTVAKLHRLQFGPYQLGNLGSGKLQEFQPKN